MSPTADCNIAPPRVFRTHLPAAAQTGLVGRSMYSTRRDDRIHNPTERRASPVSDWNCLSAARQQLDPAATRWRETRVPQRNNRWNYKGNTMRRQKKGNPHRPHRETPFSSPAEATKEGVARESSCFSTTVPSSSVSCRRCVKCTIIYYASPCELSGL